MAIVRVPTLCHPMIKISHAGNSTYVLYVYTYIYICMYICIYTCIQIYICIHVHTYMHTYISTYAKICTYVYMYVYLFFVHTQHHSTVCKNWARLRCKEPEQASPRAIQAVWGTRAACVCTNRCGDPSSTSIYMYIYVCIHICAHRCTNLQAGEWTDP